MTNDSGSTASSGGTTAASAPAAPAEAAPGRVARPVVGRQPRRTGAGGGATAAGGGGGATAAAGPSVAGPGGVPSPASEQRAAGSRRAPATPPAEPPDVPEPARAGALGPGTGVLAVLALAYLVAIMRSAQATIQADSGALAVTSAAYALPGVVSAILVAGTALGLVAVAALTRWVTPDLSERPGRRLAVALGAGLLTGLGAASTVVLAYGAGTASMVLAGTVAAAGTIGGAIAGLRARHLVAAAVAAALAVFAVGFVLNFFKNPLLSLYGFGGSERSKLSAYGWFAITAALGGGLAAGAVAFAYLRRAWRPDGSTTPLRHSLGYLLAGAGPGLMLLVGEVVTRLGGGRVLDIASAVSNADGIGQSLLDGSRLKYALLVLFVGGLAAMVAFGRTVRPPSSD